MTSLGSNHIFMYLAFIENYNFLIENITWTDKLK